MAGAEFYRQNADAVMKRFKTGKEGLTSAEAQKRLEKYGVNELREEERVSPWEIFLRQFKNLLIIILIAAVIVSAVIGFWIDAAVILAIVVLNALLGFFQESKAEKAMQALKHMITPHAIVIRNGHQMKISAKELVPGDIILLEAGAQVPADARMTEVMNLRVNESMLTGESVPVEKITEVITRNNAVGERRNMVFMGTIVSYGRGKAVVTATGMETEMGKIAEMVQIPEEATPLQKKFTKLGKQLSVLILGVCAVITLIGVAQGQNAIDMFLTGLSLAVAAIPEGLPAVITITLALGLQKMAKRKAVVRNLPAVETLGATTVICSDKTGTLTENEMTVREIYVNSELVKVTGEGYEVDGEFTLNGKKIGPEKKTELMLALKTATLCNNASIGHEVIGSPTESALVVAAAKAGINEKIRDENPKIAEISFDSKRKRMTTIHETNDGLYAYTKGAPEAVLARCAQIYKNGKVQKLTKKEKELLLKRNSVMGENALRVLAVAYKKVKKQAKYTENLEKELVFIGLIGMIDPPREEVAGAIQICKEAGIRVVMITGDYEKTAVAIAKEVGLLGKKDSADGLIFNGTEVEKMHDKQLESIVEKTVIFARVSPKDKKRIVEALKKRGHITAVTGDGVNDAPALKAADIGVAMGIRGTDVAKEASDMVIEDDNFATIVSAVRHGRTIFSNIRKFVRYLLSCNAGEVLAIFVASFLLASTGMLPLLPIQLLWLNLVTDGLPAVALGLDPPERDIMHRRPRNPKEPIINRDMMMFILVTGIIMCAVTLGIFYLELSLGTAVKAQTMAFTTLMAVQMLIVFSARTERSLFGKNGTSFNKYLWLAVMSSIALQAAVIYIPQLQPMFHTVTLGVMDLTKIVALCAAGFLALEIFKAVKYR